jgi:hypothetical protein
MIFLSPTVCNGLKATVFKPLPASRDFSATATRLYDGPSRVVGLPLCRPCRRPVPIAILPLQRLDPKPKGACGVEVRCGVGLKGEAKGGHTLGAYVSRICLT